MAIAPPPLAQSVLDADDISTTSLYISAGTDKQQACWTWLRALSATTLDGMAGFPARRSVAQSDTTNQAMPGAAETYQAYMQALDRVGQVQPGGETFGTPPIDYYWFYRAIDRALQGKEPGAGTGRCAGADRAVCRVRARRQPARSGMRAAG